MNMRHATVWCTLYKPVYCCCVCMYPGCCVPCVRSTPATACCTQQCRQAYSLRGQRRCQCSKHTHQRASALVAVSTQRGCFVSHSVSSSSSGAKRMCLVQYSCMACWYAAMPTGHSLCGTNVGCCSGNHSSEHEHVHHDRATATFSSMSNSTVQHSYRLAGGSLLQERHHSKRHGCPQPGWTRGMHNQWLAAACCSQNWYSCHRCNSCYSCWCSCCRSLPS